MRGESDREIVAVGLRKKERVRESKRELERVKES